MLGAPVAIMRLFGSIGCYGLVMTGTKLIQTGRLGALALGVELTRESRKNLRERLTKNQFFGIAFYNVVVKKSWLVLKSNCSRGKLESISK